MDFDKDLWATVASVALAIVGVASLAVFFSKNSNTAGVISAGGNAFSNALGAAEAPVLAGSSYSFPTNSMSEF